MGTSTEKEKSSQPRQIRWGILGTGRIANKFVSEFSRVPTAIAAGVASRQLSRAQEFAQKYNIPHAYGSYEELLAQPQIEVVYIGLVNSQHYELCRRALLAGKAVLCEKPFTLNPFQAQELVALAREKHLFLMEGIWTRCFPVMTQIKKVLESGELGPVRMAQMDFGFMGNLDPQGRLMNPALGGGALNDVGIYPLTTAQYFLGKITDFKAMATLSSTGVDTRILIVAQHESGAVSSLHASIDTATRKEAYLFTELATLHLPAPFWKAPRATCTIHGGGVGSCPDVQVVERHFESPYEGNGFEFEIAHVCECLRQGKEESPLMPLDETVQTAFLMEQIRKQCHILTPEF